VLLRRHRPYVPSDSCRSSWLVIMALWPFQRPYALDHEGFVPARRACAPTFHAGASLPARFVPICGHRRREKSGKGGVSRGAGGLRIWRAMPHRWKFHHQGSLRARAGAAVTPGPDAPAGTCAPDRVCREWSNHDTLLSSMGQPRHTARCDIHTRRGARPARRPGPRRLTATTRPQPPPARSHHPPHGYRLPQRAPVGTASSPTRHPSAS
jgi:hypothetical protein